MSASPPTWTPDRITELRKYFDAGLTCSQIAAEIGVSRNSVIGKLSRLGLARGRGEVVYRRPRTPRTETRQVRTGTRQVRVDTRHGQVRILRSLRAEMEAAVADEPADETHRCSLYELSAENCRWPIGRPGADDFGFCGCAPVDGLPYCPRHARMAYRSTAQRTG